MVLATVAGEDRAAESLRRLGVMRIATKYPRLAARHFLDTGRQAEIVEVKGSVELAPLTGLVEAIVDLTATGTTLRENGLVVREEIAVCTARLIANPVAHKLKATAIDAAPGAARWDLSGRSLRGAVKLARELRALVPAPEAVAETVTEILERVRREGDAALRLLHRAHTTPGAPPVGAAGEPEAELAEADRTLDPASRAGSRRPSPTYQVAEAELGRGCGGRH